MGFRGLAAAIAAVVGLSGCGALKDAKDMKKTTEEMNKKTDHLQKRTDDMEREFKVGETTEKFTMFMDRLFGENGMGIESRQSGESNPETEMLAEAEKAIRALKFQFWNGDYNESSTETLDRDFEKSALLFFTRIRKYVRLNNDVNIPLVDGVIPDRGFKGIASLGARMHRVEDGLIKALALRGLPANTSFYEVVMEALRDRDMAVQGGLFPKAKKAVLEWKREAFFTVQLRHNYLPMMVISRVTKFADLGNVGRSAILVNGLRANLNDPDPELKVSNALLIETTEWLNQALETRERLRAMGVKPKYNAMMGTILHKVDLGQADIIAGRASSGDKERDKLLLAFATAYQKVVSEMPNSVGSILSTLVPSIVRQEAPPAGQPAPVTPAPYEIQMGMPAP